MKASFAFVWGVILTLSACATAPVSIEAYSVSSELTLAYQDSENSVYQLSLLPEIEASLGEQATLVASLRLRLDAADDLTPDEPLLGNYSSYSKPATLGNLGTVELRDFYIDVELQNLDFRIGKQQIVWGELDGFKNLDVINPQSFREFILDDFESSRIGLWAVSTRFNLAGWNSQVFWSPDSTVHETATPEATFGFSAPRYTFNANSLGLSGVNYLDNQSNDSAYGIRFNRLTDSGFDLAVSYVSGIDHAAVAQTVNQPNDRKLLIQENQRRDVWGLSMTKALNNTVLRAEVGYRHKKAFSAINENALVIEKRDQVIAAIGIDIDGPGSWFTNIQYLHDNVQSGDSSLVRPLKDNIVTFYTRRSWSNETVFFDLKWYSTDSFSDGLVRPAVRYLVSDSVSASIGLDAFYGNADGLFGQFDKNDRVVFKLEHIF